MPIHQSTIWKISLTILSWIISISVSGQPQIKIDSLLNIATSSQDAKTLAETYGQLHQAYYRVDEKNFKKYLDLELKYAQESKVDSIYYKAKYHEARYLYEVDQFPAAFKILEEIEPLIRNIKLPKLLGNLLHMKASLYGVRGEYLKALENELESLEIRKANNEKPEQIAACMLNIGHVHGSIENIESSSDYYNQARKLYEQVDAHRMAVLCKSYIGLNEKILGNLSIADSIFNECISDFENLELEEDIPSILSYLGGLEQERNNLDMAYSHYLSGAKICKKYQNVGCMADQYQRLAELNILKKNFNQAIEFSKMSLSLNEMMDYKEGLKRDYLFLNESYSELGDFKNAYLNLSKFQVLKDSMFNSEKIAAIDEIETRYQTEKKEQQIVLLKEREEKNKLEKNVMIAGIFSLLGLFAAIFYAMKQRLAKNNLAKEKVDQQLIFKNKELNFNKKELDLKKQELTAYALQLAHKNEVLEEIKSNIIAARDQSNQNQAFQKVINKIDINQNDNDTWDGFRTRFLAVHKDFEVIVKKNYPQVSSNEMRIMALLKMNLTSKEIANILNISAEGIKKARYRLRKKLGLQTKDSLEELILNI